MLTTERQFGFTTRQLHAGYDPESTTGSRAVPIYQTSAYDLQSTDRATRLFALQENGHIYSRISNPTSISQVALGLVWRTAIGAGGALSGSR